ncbi:putative cytochrome 83B1-like [Capsicum annuum]|nr:putative cytochrome 83B1-like [Capsicum annuum]KAF3637303.1 putative cytochrome 83B1-like [Capsicum annuum]
MEKEAEVAVRLLNSDGDGLLGFEDFTKLMEGMEKERNKKSELIGAFGMYIGMEGGGYITSKSLKRMLSRLALDSSTNPELFELYIVDGLLYPGGDKSRDILLDRCRLCCSELDSP